jgi:FKBP-type peptidyl-prolyl cis-trans isomerase
MKLMYSIIIVLVAAAVLFYVLKKTDKTEIQTMQSQDVNVGAPEEQPVTSAPSSQPVAAGSEMLMTTTKEGTGEGAKDGDTLSVHYTGYLEDGTKFDSSVDRGTPFELTLGSGMVIQGWDIGLKGMKEGEMRKLVIPAKYAYGENGFPGVIPPNATLIFEVELVDIK